MQEKPIDVEIRCVSRQIIRELFSTSRHRKIESEIGTNWWIIGYIDRNRGHDVFQKDLEKEFSVSRSTASKNVDLLIRNGFISRENVDYDARLKKLVLTDKANEILDLMKKNDEELENRITKNFTEMELCDLRKYLHRISENLETIQKEETAND